MTSEAEILVHITAPSTSKDDALYRAFATAYLDFEPGRKLDLPKDPRATQPASPPTELLSPQASFQSVWDNVRRPAALKYPQQNEKISSDHGRDSQEQDSWVQPPSEVADSMPDDDIRIDGFTTPTRIMKYFLQTAGPPSEPSQESGQRDVTSIHKGIDEINTVLARGTDSILRGHVPTNIPSVQKEASSLQHNDDVQYETPGNNTTTSESRMDDTHVSQTPSSPLRPRGVPPPPLMRSSGECRARSSGITRTSQQSQSEVPGITIPATQPPDRADSEPPSSKRLKSIPLQANSRSLGRSISDVLPRASKGSAILPQMFTNTLAAPATQVIDWTRETQLISVDPPPANYKLGPRVPVKLELLMSEFGRDGRYKPKFQARKMRHYERGYWLLDIHDWDHQGKVEMWGFLGNYIRKDGFAGWGTRACRDEDWKWMRLYGWEHIAGELYILLYVASYRRLKAMEVTWYDGAGKELIVVGARTDKRTLNLGGITAGMSGN